MRRWIYGIELRARNDHVSEIPSFHPDELPIQSRILRLRGVEYRIYELGRIFIWPIEITHLS